MTFSVSGVGQTGLFHQPLPQEAGSQLFASTQTSRSSLKDNQSATGPASWSRSAVDAPPNPNAVIDTLGSIEQDIDIFLYDLQTAFLRLDLCR
jgi:hypothetical protein